MGCTPFSQDLPDGKKLTGFICGGRTQRRRCESCGQLCVPRLCDGRLEGPCPKCKGTGRRGRGECPACTGSGLNTCNRVVCKTCAAHVKGKDLDYCPRCRVAAGFPPLIWREPCRFADQTPPLANRRCLRQSCAAELIDPGERVLYFAQRGRAMHASCGEEYLKVSTVRPRR